MRAPPDDMTETSFPPGEMDMLMSASGHGHGGRGHGHGHGHARNKVIHAIPNLLQIKL